MKLIAAILVFTTLVVSGVVAAEWAMCFNRGGWLIPGLGCVAIDPDGVVRKR